MEVRRMQIDDIPQVAAIVDALQATSAVTRMVAFDMDSMLKQLYDFMMSPDVVVFVLADGTRIAGAAAAIAAPVFYNHRVMQAKEVFWYLLPEGRGKGYARSLLQHLEDWAASQHVTVFGMATVTGTDPHIVPALKRWGYIEQETTFIKRI